MTRRHDLILAYLIIVWFTVLLLLFLAACQMRGFDDSMCRTYSACVWRDN